MNIDPKTDLTGESLRTNAGRSIFSTVRSLIRVSLEYAITHVWASGIGPLPVGERSLGQRRVEEA